MDPQRRSGAHGFTLVELMIAIAIFASALVSLVGAYIGFFILSETSRTREIATADAQSLLERMRNISPFTNGAVQAQFPGGTPVAGYANLSNEQVVVTYPNPAAVPLEVRVQVNWDLRARPLSLQLSGLMRGRRL